MPPSICLIAGDNHTPHCGVKDYAIGLATALERIGMRAELMAPPDWSMQSFLRFCGELRQRNFDIVHVHYPSIGHRHSLCPHLLGTMKVAKKAVVTLHEYTYMPILQRASTHVFRLTADLLLFTTEAELTRYGRSGVPRRVIHVGSSIPACSLDPPRSPTVLYFGQIRPEKGLEEFFELARRSLQLGRPYNFRVIGSVPPRRSDFYRDMRARSDPGIEWLMNLPSEQVSELMTSSLAAYLPFPDGASYRRTSLLAALTNGLPVITTIGPATPREMIDVLLPATGPCDALVHLERLNSCSADLHAYSSKGRSFAEKFSWAEIARQHEQAYMEALSID